jgi:hypothetical protein
MFTKICFKCGIDKPLTEYYAHKQMGDGHLNKCKDCTKKDTQNRIDVLKNDESWVKSEQKRGREKYHRLYSGNIKIDPIVKKKLMTKYYDKYPEKKATRSKISNLKPLIKGNHLHHWSYNLEHAKDVIELTPKLHSKLHRFIIYDQEQMMYRRYDTNVLLNTKEKHLEFIEIVKTLED